MLLWRLPKKKNIRIQLLYPECLCHRWQQGCAFLIALSAVAAVFGSGVRQSQCVAVVCGSSYTIYGNSMWQQSLKACVGWETDQ